MRGYPLELQLNTIATEHGLVLRADYATDIYDRERIARLLAPVVDDSPVRARWVASLCTLTALSVAVMAGLHYGDLVVRALPGVLP